MSKTANVEKAITILQTLTNREFVDLLEEFGLRSYTDSEGIYRFESEITEDNIDSSDVPCDEFIDDEDILEYLKNPDIKDKYKQFVRALASNGYQDKIRLNYKGRFFYDGPACDCSSGELNTIVGLSPVPVQWDSMGLGSIVYPK
ncbi:MAG: hypothetical protein AABY22_17965 [Nanoarchaeota archaeon]